MTSHGMNYIPTAIPDVYIMEPEIYRDVRGYFMETWRQSDFDAAIGYCVNFIQDNQSCSTRGVLRGLHYQRGADAQAKLVRVLKGEVVDVAVDLRRNSPTFGQHVSVILNEENQRQLFIPRGFAHGFQVLSEKAIFMYKVDNRYAPESEASIRYDDPKLGIQWPITAPDEILLSEKDLLHAVPFDKAETF